MDDIAFPRLAYKVGGPWALECGNFSCREVPDASTFEAMREEGWFLTQEEASSATTERNDHGQEQEGQGRQGQEGLLTLEELRAKAGALGIAFRPQWRERKLADAIAEVEQAAQA